MCVATDERPVQALISAGSRACWSRCKCIFNAQHRSSSPLRVRRRALHLKLFHSFYREL